MAVQVLPLRNWKATSEVMLIPDDLAGTIQNSGTSIHSDSDASISIAVTVSRIRRMRSSPSIASTWDRDEVA